MPIQTVEVTIKEDVYSFTTFTGVKGLSYLKKILKVVGPSLAALFDESEESMSEMAADLGIEKAVSLLIENMDSVDVEKLITDMLKDVQKNNQPISFDLEFSANYKVMMLLVLEVVKANYGDFFQEGGFDLG